jgi:hypothetical protein
VYNVISPLCAMTPALPLKMNYSNLYRLIPNRLVNSSRRVKSEVGSKTRQDQR